MAGHEIKEITRVGALTKKLIVRQIFTDVNSADIIITENQSYSGAIGSAMYASIPMGITKDIFA